MPGYREIRVRENPYSRLFYTVFQKALLAISVAETSGNTQGHKSSSNLKMNVIFKWIPSFLGKNESFTTLKVDQ